MKQVVSKMKRRTAPLMVAASIGVGALGVAAHAQTGNSGQTSQSQTAPAPNSAGAKAPAANGAAPKPAAKPAPANGQQPELVVKIKSWVKQKWTELVGRFGPGQAPQPTQAAVPPAPKKVVPPSAIGGSLAAPGTPVAPKPSESTGRGTASTDAPAGPQVTDIPKAASGVPVYDIGNVESIPHLGIGKETRIKADQYALTGDHAKFFEQTVAHQAESPALLTPKQMLAFTKLPKASGRVESVKTKFTSPGGKVSRAEFDKIVLVKKPENPFQLAKYTPLTPEELRFLSGLLLYQQGEKCAVAVGLFHSLSKSAKYEAEGNYYQAMCSKKLGLMTDFIDRARKVVETQDAYYTKKMLPEVSPDVPYEFIEPFGKALLKVAANKQIMSFDKAEVEGNINYIIANYGAQTENFKLAQSYAKLIPEKHPKWAQAQFLLSLSEYQTGSKKKALALQSDLVTKLDTDKTKMEFQALVSLNLARMNFQERKFKEAHEWFLKVYKDHPLWLQSLQEMGWSQLQSGDFEGAIGNMYSVQSPYFNSVYKPESYVIRTIGYLNLCQYGDAYRTLTILEKMYRPWLDRMASYQKPGVDYMGTVRKFLTLKSASAEIDGLPSQVIREMVRHKDFLNLQTSLNRQIDERDAYARLDKDVDKSLARARWLVTNSRKRADDLRAKIASIKKNPQLEQNRLAWKSELDNELDLLNGYFFEIDLFNEAKGSLQSYKAEVVAGAEKRITKMKDRIVGVLADRLKRMRTDLARMLENNELLRYEVFAGSGENIRYQVAGGEKGNRVPASAIPQSKSLQWDFDGEYWEDEVGHYRSSLKNNCPDSKQASL